MNRVLFRKSLLAVLVVIVGYPIGTYVVACYTGRAVRLAPPSEWGFDRNVAYHADAAGKTLSGRERLTIGIFRLEGVP